ncbi:phage protein GemA/Gp16 family protein [Alkaliflexus imshenetskii]|uniref:phage protein GemA/Gp16 family protein n=1 Tax=Alkaliflexus imshenetskii TaxID=286730 RepID=UPI0004788143|nr:phage protein GemA/Gp16 family protein [Alkaliflexus imshenetskii]
MKKLAAKNQLIRLYHTLATKLNMSDEARMGVLAAFGVESSKEMTIDQLQEVCRLLKQQLNNDSDKWRKRVMASIYGYLQLTGRKANTEYVKAIAMRSAGDGYASFNQIPVSKLKVLYYAFLDKQKTLKRTGELMNDDMDFMQFQN